MSRWESSLSAWSRTWERGLFTQALGRVAEGTPPAWSWDHAIPRGWSFQCGDMFWVYFSLSSGQEMWTTGDKAQLSWCFESRCNGTPRQSLCIPSGISSGECFIPELFLQRGRTFHRRLLSIILSLPTLFQIQLIFWEEAARKGSSKQCLAGEHWITHELVNRICFSWEGEITW